MTSTNDRSPALLDMFAMAPLTLGIRGSLRGSVLLIVPALCRSAGILTEFRAFGFSREDNPFRSGIPFSRRRGRTAFGHLVTRFGMMLLHRSAVGGVVIRRVAVVFLVMALPFVVNSTLTMGSSPMLAIQLVVRTVLTHATDADVIRLPREQRSRQVTPIFREAPTGRHAAA